MIVSAELLLAYTGVSADLEDVTTIELYNTFCLASQAEVINYLGFNPENDTGDEERGYKPLDEFAQGKIKNVILEIAALIAMEQGNNLGVSSSSDGMGVNRTYLNVVDYSKYLEKLSAYRRNTEM